ncbi:hypothetical protein ACSBR1_022824 [Camellia fascicularis]
MCVCFMLIFQICIYVCVFHGFVGLICFMDLGLICFMDLALIFIPDLALIFIPDLASHLSLFSPLFFFLPLRVMERKKKRKKKKRKKKPRRHDLAGLTIDSTVDAGNNKIESCITEHFYPYGVDYNNQYTGRFTNGLTADFMASASFPALFVFGDSTVDAGNNNKIERGVTANFYPYGVDYNNQSTGRFTNGLTAADFMGTLLTYYYNNQSIGRSAADFMAFSLVDVPPRPAYHNLTESDRKRTTIAMAGINYGSSGCGIFTTTRPPERECFNLEQQIDFFKETVQEDLPYLIPDPDARRQYLAKSVFFISMGANDYFFTYPKSNTKDPNEFAISLIFELKIYVDGLKM